MLVGVDMSGFEWCLMYVYKYGENGVFYDRCQFQVGEMAVSIGISGF